MSPVIGHFFTHQFPQRAIMASIAKYLAPEDLCLALESNLQRMSLEFQFGDNFVNSLREVIPGLTAKIDLAKTTVSEFFNAGQQYEETLSKKQRKVVDKLKELDFLNFGELLITVPENFKGSLTDYVELLVAVAPKTYAEINALLGEYNAILSSFVTNKTDKTALRTHEALFRGIQRSRADREKALNLFFPRVTGKSKQRIKDVVQRFADVETLFKVSSKLTAIQTTQNLNLIQASVQQSVDLLNLILTSIESKETVVIGPEAAQNISAGAYEVAKEVEHLSVLYFNIMTALAAVDSLANVVIEK